MLQIFKLIILLLILPTNLYAGYHGGKLLLKKDFSKVNSSFETDYRYNNTGLYYKHYDLGVEKPLAQNWYIGLNYRAIYVHKNNQWHLEKRPHMQIKKTINTDLVKLSLRTRLEYRYKSDDSESARNRSKLAIKSQYRILKLKPFISNEWFYDLDKEKYNKNWLAIGAEFPKQKFGKFSVYYKHVTDLEPNDNWSSSYSIVSKLSYKF